MSRVLPEPQTPASPAPESPTDLTEARIAEPPDDDAAPVGVSTTRRVLRGALLLLSTQPITWASSLLMTIFIPRLLDSRSLGEFTVAITFSGLIGTIVSLGLPTVLTRRISSHPATARADTTSALVVMVGIGAIAAAICIAVVPLTGWLAVSAPLLAVAMIGMVIVQGQSVLNAALTGYQWMGRFAWTNALLTVAMTVLAIVVLYLGGGAIGLALSMSLPIGVVVVAAWLWLGLGFDWLSLSWRGLRTFATLGLPFLAWTVLLKVRSEGEAILLASMLNVETVGWWAAALRIISIPVFVPVLITTPLLPALSEIASDRKAFASTLNRAFELTFIVTIGVSGAIFAFAPIIPSLLGWGPEYQAAIPLIQILVFIFPPVSIGMVFGTGLMALRDERRLLLANVGSTVVQYGLFWLAVPLTAAWLGNGGIGAAVSRVVGECVMLVAAIALLPRGVTSLGTWLFAGRVLLAGAAMVVVSMLLIGWFWPVAAVLGGLTYAVALVLLRTIRLSDAAEALTWLRGRLHRR